MASVDVTIRGAGAFGLAVAWACQAKGARVRVVDPNGVGAGASGGLVGALAPHVPENWNPKKAFQFKSLDGAEAFWREVEEVGGEPSSYGRTGRVQPIADDHALALAQARTETARELWQGRYTWEVVEAGDWAPISPTGKVIYDTLTARMFPRLAVRSLAAAITARGGEIVGEAPDDGAVVWATGATGLVEMTAQHTRLVGAPIKGQSALLDFDARHLPQIFAGGVHIVPHANGTIAIGSTTEREFDDPTSTDTQLDDVLAAAVAALPALADAPVIERWAGLRPRARTRAPMLGPWPDRPGHFVANGGFKIGFGVAPEVGRTMADLIFDARDTIPDGFRVEDNL